jgi:hypothetical protein
VGPLAMLAVVKAGDIFEVIWVSIVAGVFVTVTFSFVVLGMARSAVARRAGRENAAVGYAGLAVLAFAVFVAVVAYGVHVMLTKS